MTRFSTCISMPIEVAAVIVVLGLTIVFVLAFVTLDRINDVLTRVKP